MILLPLFFTVVIPISYPGISENSLQRLERAVVKEMSHEASPAPDTFGAHLSAVLGDELKEARDAYYRFDWRRAEERLAGRSDPEAILLRALVAFAQGQDDLTRRHFLRLLGLHRIRRSRKKIIPPGLFRSLHR